MNESLFQKSFTMNDVPHWPCPSCEKGILRLKKEDFVSVYNGSTDSSKDDQYFDHDWVRYVFHGLLRCNLCPEKVVFAGTGFVEQDYDDSERGWSYFDNYAPKYFHPVVMLIDIENKRLVPEKVLVAVDKACELFWADLDASANRIRTAVEYILDDLKIPRKIPRPRKRLNLHERIGLLTDPKLEDVKTVLEAVKWIGNTGAHEQGGLGREQVIEGFRMLEHSLSTLYPKPVSNPAAILAVAKAVNTARGGLSAAAIRQLQRGAMPSNEK